MPQFDISSFFNQVIWLSIFFSGFYFLIVGFLLPNIVSGIKARSKKEKSELLLDTKGVSLSHLTGLTIKLNEKTSILGSGFSFLSAR